MSMERRGASVVAHGGKIYAIGGEGDAATTRTAEVYDPVKDEWESIPPMSTARRWAGAASLGGKIYIVGGKVAYDEDEDLASGECYDPKTKVWTRIPDMIDVRGSTEAVAIDGALIVAGYQSNVMERYSPTKNAWETIKVGNATEDSEDNDFRIEGLCTVSKKYLPKNLENMNNN